jgi:hypothetical protein
MKPSVNINIQLPDELHKKLKTLAVMKDTTLKEIIIKQLEKRAKK